MADESQPARLRVVDPSGEEREPRRYAQSTSGRMVSHETRPSDSLSMLTARDSPQVLQPYATLLRCRKVVPQRRANDSRSATELLLRNSFSSMPLLHHTVLNDATPNGEFTKWCHAPSIPGMDSSELKNLKLVRTENLIALIRRDFAGNAAALARECEKSPSYINDLVAGRKPSFGEKAVMAIESGAGLIRGQLSIKNSPLTRDPSRAAKPPDSIDPIYKDLDEAGKKDAFEYVIQLKAKKHRRLRA